MRRRRVAWLALAVAAACTPPGAPAKAIAVPWKAARTNGGSLAGARWAYVPRRAAPLGSRERLDDAKTLLFGGHGERWIVDAPAGAALAAGELADEPLIALARPPSGAWLFVGAGGTVYEATDPIGPFVRVLAPPEPVARVDGAGGLLAAVTRRGTLLVSRDGGASFARAAIDGFVSDVALSSDVHALALVQPERLFATRDGGATWTLVDAPSVGASRLVRGANGSVAVVGWYSALTWSPDARPTLRDKLPPPPSFALDAELAPAPDAGAVREGRAFVRRGTFLTAIPPSKRGEPWSLGQAKLGERLTSAPLPGTEGCTRLAIDGDDRYLVAACSAVPRGASVAIVRVLRWANAALEPEALAWPLEGPLGDARVAVGPEARVMAWGACRPGGAKACDPDVPLLLTRWETLSSDAVTAAASASAVAAGHAGVDAGSPWLAASAPALGGRPFALRFGAGDSAFLVARRAKPRDVALFVSHDGGHSFEPRELGVPDDPRLAANLSTSEPGVVAIAFEGAAPAVVLTDDDGRVVSSSRPPRGSSAAHVGVDGRRALLVEGAEVSESLDGGATWEQLGPQASLRCDPKQKCDHPIVCAPEGCLVGASVARVGWGASRSERRVDPDAPLATAPRAPPLAAPIVCRLAKEKWTPLPKGLFHVPTATDAERGKSAWATFAEDPLRGSFTMVHAQLGSGKIEETTLLAPVRDPATVAVAVSARANGESDQVEGAAAVRFSTANDRGDLEIAWANLFEGQVSRAVIAGAEPPAPNVNFSPRPAPVTALPNVSIAGTARVTLLSITAGGIFVRPLLASGDPPLYFVDHRGRVEKSGYPGFPSITLDGQTLGAVVDAVRVDGKSVPVANVRPDGQAHDALTGDSVGLVRARPRGHGFVFDALSLAPSTQSPFRVTTSTGFSYLGDVPLYVVRTESFDGGVAVDLFPFRADGAVVGPSFASPSQLDASVRFRACTAADRAKTPRVVVPPELGTRRAIVIEGPDGARFATLLSDHFALYGTRASPCVAALDGVPVREEDGAIVLDGADGALVYPGDLEHSWFFRVGAEPNTADARAMRCRVDPNAALPPALEAALESGVVRPKAKPLPGVRVRP